MRASISATMRSQMAYPAGRITMVPRTGPLSASSALVIRSWYQRGKSSAREVSTRATSAHDRGSCDDPAAQDDPLGLQERAEVGPGIGPVDHEVRQPALDQAGEAQPLPRPPRPGP